jgi:hypothetical protein
MGYDTTGTQSCHEKKQKKVWYSKQTLFMLFINLSKKQSIACLFKTKTKKEN